MNIWNADKIMRRLDKMLDNAMLGKPIENGFDETRMSALETKLARNLAMTGASKTALAEEKQRLDELVSNISHQTKTPIANILLYSQLLNEAELSEQNKLCVKSLTEQAEKLNFLIAALVKASRLESGIVTLSPKMQPIAPMLGDVLAQERAQAEGKSIEIISEPTDQCASFDRKWTAEAIFNILDNAVKYTPCGGEISVSVTAYQLFCRIDVCDTGIGISEEDTAKIFTRFYRAHEVQDVAGVGLGLYLAREIVAGQGGYIKASSRTGQGSTFSIFLPIS